MELIWGEIAIGLKAVAEELGCDLSDEADLQRCVDTFQGAVWDSRLRTNEAAPCPDWSMEVEHDEHRWMPPSSGDTVLCPGWKRWAKAE